MKIAYIHYLVTCLEEGTIRDRTNVIKCVRLVSPTEIFIITDK